MTIVNSKGNTNNPKFFFVGDTPTRDDVEYKLCFAGTYGRILDSIIRDVSIPRADCYFTNLINNIPEGNNFSNFYLDSKETTPSILLTQSIESLQSDIERINPSLIILLGSKVWRALNFQGSLSDWRGSIIHHQDRYYMPTHHPSDIIKRWYLKYIVASDLSKAKSFIDTPSLHTSFINVTEIKNTEEAIKLITEYLPGKLIALDLETSMNSAEILCIGLSASPYIAYSIDLRALSLDDKASILYELHLLLNREDTKIIMHNSAFDISVLQDNEISCNNLFLDTMHSFHLLYSEMEKSLSFVQSIYTLVPYHKYMSHQNLLIYNGYDAGVTYLIAEHIIKELEESKLTDFYFNYLHKLILPLISMNKCKVDKDALNKMILDNKCRLEELQKALNEIVGYDINVNSPKQVSNLLYKEYNLKSDIHKSTDDTTLSILKVKYPSFIAIFNLIKEIRHLKKLLTTYLNPDILDGDYMHTTYNLSGTKSGRLSSSSSLIHRGINIQTPPKEIRKIFIPHEGNILISADLSQAELRIVAYLANDFTLIDKLNSDSDVFVWIAGMIFNTDNVTDTQRQIAKRLVHATNYGMGDKAFSILAEISVTDAKMLKFKYFQAFPQVKDWQDSIIKKVSKTYQLTTILGRTRSFYDRLNDNEVLSYLPQSIVSDLCLKGLLNFWNWCKSSKKATPLIEIHDAIVTECKEEDADLVSSTLKEAMTIPLQFDSGLCVIPVKVKKGFNWYDIS